MRLPHARGGVSRGKPEPDPHPASSPRTWGCFLDIITHRHLLRVFPTHVGVFPAAAFFSGLQPGLPHARGGVSIMLSVITGLLTSSPRTWGCFCGTDGSDVWHGVFPTHVGVFPDAFEKSCAYRRLPHARGGVSHNCRADDPEHPSSPRTWGCFFLFGHVSVTGKVFPTHVGVFPPLPRSLARSSCLPHARGGVSNKFEVVGDRYKSSPRTWGCFSSP